MMNLQMPKRATSLMSIVMEVLATTEETCNSKTRDAMLGFLLAKTKPAEAGFVFFCVLV